MESVDPRSFDVFISYKNSDAQGELTQDAKLAFALHDALEEHGIKAFCSTLSLTRMGQSAYKDAINQALDAARIMVVVGTNIDNILSPWVKYEWGSFHDDLLTGRKTTGTLVSYISGMNPNELPRELRSYESFPLEQGGDVRIVEFIQACMENRVELGYAGTATGSRRLAVLKATTGHGLINAQDPDLLEASNVNGSKAAKPGDKKASHRRTVVTACVIAVLIVGLGIGYYAYTKYQADQEAQAQEQAQQQAAAEQAAQEQAAKEAAEQEQRKYEESHSNYTVQYLVKGTKKGAKGFPKTLTVEDAKVGSTVSLKVPSIKGYTISSVSGAKLNSKKSKASFTLTKKAKGTAIKMYYTKNETVTPSYTPSNNTSSGTNSGSTSGGTTSGSSGGSTSGGSGSSGKSNSGGNSSGGGKKVPKDWIVD